ncbi:MAG: helix-turn-helix transcriptional regulator [Planctomycetes bacterium]|nr:helix-turn-helix transcriptional regulator [Planctomycetota bacterium]
MSIFGIRLRDTRRTKNLTQEKLAEATGLSQAAISQFEKGERVPTPSTTDKLAKFLGVERELLVGHEEVAGQAKILMRNLKELSPESRREITKIVEKYLRAEGKDEQNTPRT